MRQCVVPQGPTREMINAAFKAIMDAPAGTKDGESMRIFYIAMLAFRPPLPADIEAALALAEEIVSYRTKYQYREDDATMKISHALRKACGRE